MAARITGTRWTIEQAASEFQIDRKTLGKRLKSNGETGDPGEDGKYSTKQIIDAVFTDYETARARKMAAEARITEREDRRDAGELLDANLVASAWESVVSQIKHRVQMIPSKLQSRLSLTQIQTKATEQECDDALAELSKTLDYKPDEVESAQDGDA
jgi:phage terminase Nu1 subunit (DNA packaging protein)